MEMSKKGTQTIPSSNQNFKLSVSGTDYIIDKKEPSIIRSIFLVTVVVLIGVCIAVLIERNNYFYSDPVNFSFEIQHVHNLQFPKFTICAFQDTITSSVPKEIHNLEDSSTTMGSFDDIVHVCAYNDDQDCNRGMWTMQNTTYGPCHTLSFDNNIRDHVEPISSFKIFLNNLIVDANGERKLMRWKMLLHEKIEDAVYGVLLYGHDVVIGSTLGIYFSHTRFIYVNVSSRPCTDKLDAFHCMQKCLDGKMSDLLQCKMPFVSTNLNDFAMCNADEAYNESYFGRLQQFVFESVNCVCNRACVEDYFNIRVDTRDNILIESTNLTSLYILPLEDEIEVMKELRAYEAYAFICDIGGTLGLYLGMCVLTIIEIIYVLAKTVVSVCHRPKQETIYWY